MQRALIPRFLSVAFAKVAACAAATDAQPKPHQAPSPRDTQAKAIATKLSSSPETGVAVLERLTPDERRHFLVAGNASEFFGSASASPELLKADKDNDDKISSKDYASWCMDTASRVTPIPMRALLGLACHTACPFVAFGFIDNFVLLCAGDLVDQTIGMYFNLSVMTAAALGGVASGTVGVQVHGTVDRGMEKLGFSPPILTAEQYRNRRVFWASHIGGTVGIATGLLLGMMPLLWLEKSERSS